MPRLFVKHFRLATFDTLATICLFPEILGLALLPPPPISGVELGLFQGSKYIRTSELLVRQIALTKVTLIGTKQLGVIRKDSLKSPDCCT